MKNTTRLTILGALGLFLVPAAASAATLTVDITSDDYDIIADGDCSLREAITAANSDGDFGGCVGVGIYGDDVIEFDAGTNGVPIQLALPGTGEDVNLTGDLDITSNISFEGNGLATTIIDGGDLDRVFHGANTELTVGFSDLTVRDGNVTGTGGGIQATRGTYTLTNIAISSNVASGNGGALYAGAVTITGVNVTIDGNTAPSGGGILLDGDASITLTDSTLFNNMATGGNGGAAARFNNTVTAVLALNNTLVSMNSADDDGGAIYAVDDLDLDISNGTTITGNTATNGSGGGLYLAGGATTIDISDSTITGNTASGFAGGGILSSTLVTINNSEISQNESVNGGGIYNFNIGDMTITDTLIEDNEATTGVGGGIYNSGAAMNVTGSTFTLNTAPASFGGAYYSNGASTDIIQNSTLSGNSAAAAGAIYFIGGTMDLDSVTIAENTGVVAMNGGAAGLTIQNSIFDNPTIDNCSGINTSNGYNIDTANTCGFANTGDQINTDPLLDVLADNGGPTETHAPLTGSPAIDMGDTALAIDQRGISRPDGIADDVGAYETDSLPVIAEVNVVPSPSTSITPMYTFSSTDSGTITYGGDCSSATTAATTGNNTITFNTLTAGPHTNCTIQVTDGGGNMSNVLAVTGFFISTTTNGGTTNGGGGGGGSNTCVHISCFTPGGGNGGTTTPPLTPEEECAGYSDLSINDPDCAAFEYVQSIGALTGNPDGTVEPDSFVQRDEMAKISLEAFDLFDSSADYCLGQNPFPDVTSEMWAYQYICRGKQLNMITGYKAGENAGKFMPGSNFNLVEFWALVLRNIDAMMPAGSSFAGFEVDAWYSGYAKYVKDNGLYDGTSPSPTELVPRRDVANFLYDLHNQGAL